MKTFSDNFSGLKRLLNRVGNRVATTALFMVAAITMAFAQAPDLTIIEGSEYSFKVDYHDENTFAWDVRDRNFNSLDPLAFTFIEGQFETDVRVKFNDLDRLSGDTLYLMVTETRPVGCSTTRALKILVEPNNMYLEFADKMTNDCYSPTDYQAPLKIGINFKDKAAGVQIPADRFPLTVAYTVQNLSAGTPVEKGNGGEPLVLTYNDKNDYFLLVKVPETVGLPNQTTMYQLEITSVTDKYGAEIKLNPEDVRKQIRIINHLPQSGNMDMALAYYIVNP